MTTFFDAFVPALGLTLLHFLWQGVALAGALAAALVFMSGRSAQERYLVRVIVLAMMMLAPVVTLILALQPDPAGSLGPALAAAPAHGVFAADGSSAAMLGRVLPWVVAVWMLGAALLLLRLLVGWLGVQQLRREPGRPLPARWQAIFDALRRDLRVRATARVVRSTVTTVPATIGWIRPLVLLPTSSLTGLSDAQIRALLAHELAHVRRADFLVNILQSFVEALLFYHPAVWWISNGIRTERECCCDEMVVDLTGDRLAYARTLTDLAARTTGRPQLGLSTLGGSLMYRIHRLLGAPAPAGRRAASTAGILMASGALASASVALGTMPATACPPETKPAALAAVDASPESAPSTYELHRRATQRDDDGGVWVAGDDGGVWIGDDGMHFELVMPDGEIGAWTFEHPHPEHDGPHAWLFDHEDGAVHAYRFATPGASGTLWRDDDDDDDDDAHDHAGKHGVWIQGATDGNEFFATPRGDGNAFFRRAPAPDGGPRRGGAAFFRAAPRDDARPGGVAWSPRPGSAANPFTAAAVAAAPASSGCCCCCCCKHHAHGTIAPSARPSGPAATAAPRATVSPSPPRGIVGRLAVPSAPRPPAAPEPPLPGRTQLRSAPPMPSAPPLPPTGWLQKQLPSPPALQGARVAPRHTRPQRLPSSPDAVKEQLERLEARLAELQRQLERAVDD